MAGGTPLQVTKLDLDPSGRGTLNIRVGALADYKAVLAHLGSDAMLSDDLGRFHRLQLGSPLPEQPSQFPCDVALPVVERALPPDAVTRRMAFGNNFLQSGCWVDVISFDPPSEDGAEGLLRVQCATDVEYAQLRRFVDEDHGSALKSMDGGVWYVHRIDDDARPDRPFPQKVSIRIEWRQRH